MYCLNCGNIVEDDALFCANCGAPIKVESAPIAQMPAAAPAKPKKKIFIPILIGVGIVVAAAVLVLIFLLGGNSGGAYLPYKSNIYADAYGNTLFVTDSKSTLKPIAEDIDRLIGGGVSEDGSAYVYVTNDLVGYYISEDSYKKFDDDINYVLLSKNGDFVYYCKDDTVMVYDGNSSKSITSFEELRVIRVSPSGKIALLYGFNDGQYGCYIYDGNNVKKLGSYYPVAISDDASAIYVTKNEKFGIIKGIDGEFEGVKGSDISSVRFSYDNKKVLYTSSGTTYYYEPSFEKSIQVFKGNLSIVRPQNSMESLSNFDSFIAECNDRIYRFVRKNDKFENYVVIKNYDNFILSEDGNNIVFMRHNSLYKKSTKSEDAEEICISKNVEDYVVDKTLSKIYFIDKNGELCYSTGNEDSVKSVFDDYVRAWSMRNNGMLTFVCFDGSIYYSDNGGKPKAISGLSESNSFRESQPRAATDSAQLLVDEDTLYVSYNGKDFINTGITDY